MSDLSVCLVVFNARLRPLSIINEQVFHFFQEAADYFTPFGVVDLFNKAHWACVREDYYR